MGLFAKLLASYTAESGRKVASTTSTSYSRCVDELSSLFCGLNCSPEEEEEPGFIVSDGHLSVCEYDFTDQDLEHDDDKKQKEIALRRERLKQQRQ